MAAGNSVNDDDMAKESSNIGQELFDIKAILNKVENGNSSQSDIPTKSSTEILSELFGAFNAEPPKIPERVNQNVNENGVVAEQKEGVESSPRSKKNKKSKKKHKHKEKKHKKKTKSSKKQGSSEDSDDGRKKRKHTSDRKKKKQQHVEVQTKESEAKIIPAMEPVSVKVITDGSNNIKRTVECVVNDPVAPVENVKTENPILKPVEVTQVKDSTPCTVAPQSKTTDVKVKTGKIVIKNLKFSSVYEETVRQVEEQAKLKAERYEEGEISEDSSENKETTPLEEDEALELTPERDSNTEKKEKRKHCRKHSTEEKHHRHHHHHHHHKSRSRSKEKKKETPEENQQNKECSHNSRSSEKKRSHSQDKRHRSRSANSHHRKRSHSRDSDSSNRKRSRRSHSGQSESKEVSKCSKHSHSRKRSESPDNSDKNKRSKHSRSHSRSRRRSESRCRSERSKHSKRSRSNSRSRRRSDSTSRSDKKKHSKHSRSRSRSRRRSESTGGDKSKRSRRSRSRESAGHIDKQKLLEIARKNAMNLLKQGVLPSSVVTQDKVVAIKAGGKSVAELTDFCKQLSKKEAMGQVSSDSEGEDRHSSGSDTERPFHHPFQIKERPSSIVMNIRNSVQLPLKTLQEKTAEQSKQLRIQFPVSSGQQHRKSENEWVPVSPKKEEITALVPVKPVEPKPVVEPVNQVFPTTVNTEGLDIGSIVSQRLTAMRKLQENPNDVQALSEMYRAQKDMQMWAESKQQPGQFTGSTGARVLTAAELASGYQAWAKKDQLTTASPVSGGMGMALLQKMGWRPGEGLGKNKEGTLEPLKLEIKMDKKGLVSQEELGRRPVPQIPPSPTTKSLVGKHPVSLLVEFCSKRRWGVPQFELCFECGPDHRKNFLFKVRVNGNEYKPSVASPNKKQAKAEAATICLQALGVLPP